MPLRSRHRTKASACRFDNGPQVTRAHRVDAERRGRHRLGDDAPRTVFLRSDGILASDAYVGLQPVKERIADAVTEHHIFGNTENLACGAVFQQAHGFVFRKPQPPQAVVIHGVRIERPHDDRIGPLLHFGFDPQGRRGIGLRTHEDDAEDQQPGQRQKNRHGPNLTFCKKLSHMQRLFTYRPAKAGTYHCAPPESSRRR